MVELVQAAIATSGGGECRQGDTGQAGLGGVETVRLGQATGQLVEGVDQGEVVVELLVGELGRLLGTEGERLELVGGARVAVGRVEQLGHDGLVLAADADAVAVRVARLLLPVGIEVELHGELVLLGRLAGLVGQQESVVTHGLLGAACCC